MRIQNKGIHRAYAESKHDAQQVFRRLSGNHIHDIESINVRYSCAIALRS